MRDTPPRSRANVAWCRLLLVAVTWLVVSNASFGQLPAAIDATTEVSIQVDTIPTFARTRLGQIDELLADRQWPEAVDALRDLVRDHGDQLVAVSGSGDGLWIPLRSYAQRKLAHGPAAALAEYRRAVDPLVETKYQQAVNRRDRAALAEIFDQWFPSSWTDDALNALAELSLEAGDFVAARAAWRRLLPPANGVTAAESNRYPDPSLSPSDVAARLVLVSILEGPATRSEKDVTEFNGRYPDATGSLAGRDARYADMLRSMAKASGGWPSHLRSTDWTTFGGGASRQALMADRIETGARRWMRAIDEPESRHPGSRIARRGPQRAQQVSTTSRYFPVTWQNIVLVANESRIVALDYRSGEPAWGLGRPVIYRADVQPLPISNQRRAGVLRRMSRFRTSGQPRYTLTVVGDRLLARMGPAWTQYPQAGTPREGASLVCLDLAAQGRLEWKRPPDNGEWRWTFEGTPVSDGRHAYVCLRRAGVYPECHVACLDMKDGRTIWRQFVCTGRHAAGGNVVISHNLLTLVGDTLYLNTNMGAVAALSTDKGELRWVRQYADVHASDNNSSRAGGSDPSPCLVNRGRVFVAPDDSDLVMAIDADDGRLLWHVATRGDITELLGFRAGAQGGELIASGRRIWCLDEATGKAVWRWPPGSDEVHSAGRGFVLGGNIYWPTSDNSIRVFREGGRDSYWPSQIRLPIVPGQPYSGDLVAAGDILLVTSENRLLAFGGARSAADTLPKSGASLQSEDPAVSQTRRPPGTVRGQSPDRLQ